MDTGSLRWARGQRAAAGGGGSVLSSWSRGFGFYHNVTVPVGTKALVMLPVATGIAEVTENGADVTSRKDVAILNGGTATTVNKIRFISVEVGSGKFIFGTSWAR